MPRQSGDRDVNWHRIDCVVAAKALREDRPGRNGLFHGWLYITLIRRVTQTCHAAQDFVSDPGFVCLKLHIEAVQMWLEDLFETSDLALHT